MLWVNMKEESTRMTGASSITRCDSHQESNKLLFFVSNCHWMTDQSTWSPLSSVPSFLYRNSPLNSIHISLRIIWIAIRVDGQNNKKKATITTKQEVKFDEVWVGRKQKQDWLHLCDEGTSCREAKSIRSLDLLLYCLPYSSRVIHHPLLLDLEGSCHPTLLLLLLFPPTTQLKGIGINGKQDKRGFSDSWIPFFSLSLFTRFVAGDGYRLSFSWFTASRLFPESLSLLLRTPRASKTYLHPHLFALLDHRWSSS